MKQALQLLDTNEDVRKADWETKLTENAAENAACSAAKTEQERAHQYLFDGWKSWLQENWPNRSGNPRMERPASVIT